MKNPAGLAKKWDFLQKCLRKKLLFRPLWGENSIFSRWAFAMGFCWWLKPEKKQGGFNWVGLFLPTLLIIRSNM